MGCGVHLPEFTDLAALPAPDWSRRAPIGPGMSQLMLDGPPPDLSAVELELALPQHLAGGKAVRSRRFTAQPLAQQRLHLRRPLRGMIAAGNARDPKLLLPASTSAQVLGVELIKTTPGQPQLLGGGFSFEFASAKMSQNVAD